jgi:hypothetical protein
MAWVISRANVPPRNRILSYVPGYDGPAISARIRPVLPPHIRDHAAGSPLIPAPTAATDRPRREEGRLATSRMGLRPVSAHLLFPPSATCYAQHGVDRPASRHAGLHSASTSLPCSMEVQPCSCHLRPVIRLRH